MTPRPLVPRAPLAQHQPRSLDAAIRQYEAELTDPATPQQRRRVVEDVLRQLEAERQRRRPLIDVDKVLGFEREP